MRLSPSLLASIALSLPQGGALERGGGSALALDAPVPVYSDDLADLGNRLFHAFFIAPVSATAEGAASGEPPVPRVEGGSRESIPFGAAFGAILDDPRYAGVASLLDRALGDASLRGRPALDRILLQNDLWSAHDALVLRRGSIDTSSAARLARCDALLAQLARLVANLAPRADEIAFVPVAPLPRDLARLAETGARSRAHEAAFGDRVDSAVARTPAGDSVLVTRLLAIDRNAAIRPTAIVKRIDVLAERAVDVRELDRAALVRSPLDPRALVALAPDEPMPVRISGEHPVLGLPARLGAPDVAYRPAASSCVACHAATAPLATAAGRARAAERKSASREFEPIRAALRERDG